MNINEKRSMNDLHPFISESIRDGGQFVFYPGGNSMLPTIIPNTDCVVLVEAKNLKKYDLVLFTRTDGKYVLHRIMKIHCGQYTIKGDNQNWTETTTEANIIAKVSEIRKKNGKVYTQKQFTSKTTVIKLETVKFIKRAVNKLRRIIKGEK